MHRIDKLKYIGNRRHNGKNSFGLYINDVDFLDHLEDAFMRNAPANVTWKERNNCRLVASELKRSLTESGDFDLVDTSVGYRIPGDVLLEDSFHVVHNGDLVTWLIRPPGAGIHFEVEEKGSFTFSRKQYEDEVKKILNDEANSLVNHPEFYSRHQ